jgi:hypothetical protein
MTTVHTINNTDIGTAEINFDFETLHVSAISLLKAALDSHGSHYPPAR